MSSIDEKDDTIIGLFAPELIHVSSCVKHTERASRASVSMCYVHTYRDAHTWDRFEKSNGLVWPQRVHFPVPLSQPPLITVTLPLLLHFRRARTSTTDFLVRLEHGAFPGESLRKIGIEDQA